MLRNTLAWKNLRVCQFAAVRRSKANLPGLEDRKRQVGFWWIWVFKQKRHSVVWENAVLVVVVVDIVDFLPNKDQTTCQPTKSHPQRRVFGWLPTSSDRLRMTLRITWMKPSHYRRSCWGAILSTVRQPGKKNQAAYCLGVLLMLVTGTRGKPLKKWGKEGGKFGEDFNQDFQVVMNKCFHILFPMWVWQKRV